MTPHAPGAVFTSKTDAYALVALLGTGGAGTTWRATQRSTGHPCVLKLLHLAGVERWKVVERFEREAAVLRGLDHPGIPRFVDALEDPDSGDLGLVQTWVDGRTLQQLIDGSVPLDAATFRHALEQCLDILTYLHHLAPPVVHRDVNPRNVMISSPSAGADLRAWLIDFGAVRLLAGESHTVTTVGTFGYMAPEQLMGQASAASDVYGLGVTFVALAARAAPGELPIDPATGALDVRRALTLDEPVTAVLEAMSRPGLGERLGDAAEARRRLAPRAVPALRKTTAPVSGPAVAAARPAGPESAHEPREGAPRGRRRVRWGRLAWAAPLLLLVTAWLWSLLPPTHQRQRLGGWFTGHGHLINGVFTTLVGDPAALTGVVHIECIGWSGDGRRLLTVADDELIVWDRASEGTVATVHAPSPYGRGQARWCGLSRDGSVAALVDDHAASAWQIDGSGAHLLYDREHPGTGGPGVAAGALVEPPGSPPELRFTRTAGPRTELVRASDGEVLAQLESTASHAAMTPDGTRLAVITGSPDRVVVLTVPDGEVIHDALIGKEPSGLVVAADGSTVAVAVRDGAVVWRVRDTHPLRELHQPQRYSGSPRVALAPDAAVLAVSAGDDALLVDLTTGQSLGRRGPHVHEPRWMAFAPDGSALATVGGEGWTRVWDLD